MACFIPTAHSTMCVASITHLALAPPNDTNTAYCTQVLDTVEAALGLSGLQAPPSLRQKAAPREAAGAKGSWNASLT